MLHDTGGRFSCVDKGIYKMPGTLVTLVMGGLNHKLGAFDDVFLKWQIKLIEIPAPSPNTDDKVWIFVRMFLRIDQALTVYSIEL